MLRRVSLAGVASGLLVAALLPALATTSANAAGFTGPTVTVTAGAGAGIADVEDMEFGETLLGYPKVGTVQVTVDGTEPVTFGDATIAPDEDEPVGAEDFSVLGSACAGQTVQPNDSCALTVLAIPSAPGLRAAVLTVADDTGQAVALVDMGIDGIEDATGTYYPVTPTRLIDTRTTGDGAPVSSGEHVTVPVAGRAGLPATGVNAVVVNVTAVRTASAGYLTAYPSGMPEPVVSTLNFPASWTGANLATVPLGADGAIAVADHGGAAHVLVDVMGWYAADDTFRAATGDMGTQYVPVSVPQRVWNAEQSGGRMDAYETASISLTFPGHNVTALALNVTAVDPSRNGYLAVWSGEGATPGTSTLNFTAGDTVPNMTVVPTRSLGSGAVGIAVANRASGTTQVLVDLVGVYTSDEVAGERFEAATPVRIVDSRIGLGLADGLGAGQTRTVTVPADQVDVDTRAVVGNMTGIAPTKQTFLTVWDGVASRPWVSMLNPSPGRSTAGSVFAPLDDRAGFSVFNYAGSLDLAFDVAGTFQAYPPASAFGDPVGGMFAPTDHQPRTLHAPLPTRVASDRHVS